MNNLTLIFNGNFRREIELKLKLDELEKTIEFLETVKTGNILFNFKDGKVVGVDIKATIPLTS